MTGSLYTVYMTGTAGNSIGLFYIGNGQISGIDVGGMKYEGNYTVEEKGNYKGVLTFIVPENQQLITGQKSVTEQRIDMPLYLPSDFWLNGRVIRIETPLGSLNAVFEKHKGIN